MKLPGLPKERDSCPPSPNFGASLYFRDVQNRLRARVRAIQIVFNPDSNVDKACTAVSHRNISAENVGVR